MEEKIKNSIKKIAENQKKINKEVMDKITGYILAALGFVVALAWNDAIKALIEFLFPLNKEGVSAKFVYALLMTVVIVVVTIILARRGKAAEIKK